MTEPCGTCGGRGKVVTHIEEIEGGLTLKTKKPCPTCKPVEPHGIKRGPLIQSEPGILKSSDGPAEPPKPFTSDCNHTAGYCRGELDTAWGCTTPAEPRTDQPMESCLCIPTGHGPNCRCQCTNCHPAAYEREQIRIAMSERTDQPHTVEEWTEALYRELPVMGDRSAIKEVIRHALTAVDGAAHEAHNCKACGDDCKCGPVGEWTRWLSTPDSAHPDHRFRRECVWCLNHALFMVDKAAKERGRKAVWPECCTNGCIRPAASCLECTVGDDGGVEDDTRHACAEQVRELGCRNIGCYGAGPENEGMGHVVNCPIAIAGMLEKP